MGGMKVLVDNINLSGDAVATDKESRRGEGDTRQPLLIPKTPPILDTGREISEANHSVQRPVTDPVCMPPHETDGDNNQNSAQCSRDERECAGCNPSRRENESDECCRTRGQLKHQSEYRFRHRLPQSQGGQTGIVTGVIENLHTQRITFIQKIRKLDFRFERLPVLCLPTAAEIQHERDCPGDQRTDDRSPALRQRVNPIHTEMMPLRHAIGGQWR